MSTRETLIAAKALIDTPEKWIKGDLARNQQGLEVYYKDPEACKFCIYGAVNRIDDGAFVVKELLVSLARSKGYSGVVEFNDSTSHEEVMALFDEALCRC